ncbi:UNVERIFIED_CONTAM: polar growth protein [Siphonaria sp. JEL0065]|nr:polar growth protein [Siphonaria sp. JEL0065]
MAILNFEVVGRGENHRSSDSALVAYAGWDSESYLEGAVHLSFNEKLKNVRIQAEFRAFVETRWEGLNRLATQPDHDGYKVQRTQKFFQQLVDVVYDSKSPLLPNPNGTPTAFPFRFRLPRNHIPPTFISVGGSIQYYIKCSLTYQEGMRILKSTKEIEVPVIILMPDTAKLRLYNTPSLVTQEGPSNIDKVHYNLSIPRVIVAVGDNLEVNLEITSTPANTKLRSIHASLRPVVSYVNADNIAARLPLPRPMAEISESFPLVQVGVGGIDRITRRFYLEVDPEVAEPSFESPLISVRSILRIQITIDNSEVPNISREFPVVVLPRLANPELSYKNPPASPSGSSLARTDSILDTSFFRGASIDNSVRSRSPTSFIALPNAEIPLPKPSANSAPVLPPKQSTVNPTRIQQSQVPQQQQFGSPVSQPVYQIAQPVYQSSTPAVTAGSSSRQFSNDSIHVTDSARQPSTEVYTPSPSQNSGFQQPPTSMFYHHQAAERQQSVVSLEVKGPHGPPPSTEEHHDLPPEYAELHDEIRQQPQHEESDQLQQQTPSPVSPPPQQQFQQQPQQISAEPQVPQPQPLRYDQYHTPPPPIDEEYLRQLSDMTSQASINASGASVRSFFETTPDSWTIDKVADWTRSLGAPEEIAQQFINHMVEGETLLDLTVNDLKELGVVQLGLRKKMLTAIERLKERVANGSL